MSGKRRSALRIMGGLIVLVRPLLHIMLLAVLLGTAGYLCAISLTVLAGRAILGACAPEAAVWPAERIFILMGVCAVMRGLLHYAEQYCNHFIAFKLLAVIRHQVFAALRRLCPAKLEGRDRGDLISVITTDTELLEVFYAHTISPVAIAVLTSLVMVLYIGSFSAWAGLYALAAYLTVGLLIPLWNGRRGGEKGMRFREGFGELNSFVLDSLRGLDEIIGYGYGEARGRAMDGRSDNLSGLQKDLSRMEGAQRAVTNLVILLASSGMLFLMLAQYERGLAGLDGVLLCTLALTGSFGPTAALSSLSNNLNQTLASGERVLRLLEEEPLTAEIPDDGESGFAGRAHFTGAGAEHVTFGYGEETVLEDFSARFGAGRIIGLYGPSGCGKSTLLKLLMRFWEAQEGRICLCGEEIGRIPTKRLRDCEAYVTQETQLFHDSIANNIAVAKPGATRGEIEEAAKKAAIHDFILTLPDGYDTEVGELGDTLSGGEKQRIGLARAFLHDAPFLLLDEPTSSLDALNEGIILRSLREAADGKTVVLVSHRRSTLNVADEVYGMENGRVS